MKDYYEILNSSFDAPANEIKKAYFEMVRKYPPDRCPNEFMEIQKAYETLSNEKMKKEYDMFASMPNMIHIDFEQAKKYIEENEITKAISILEDILIREPELLIPKSLLGEVYMANDNSGKAVKIYEELVKKEPDNAGFRGALAYAYLQRKYNRKAIRAFEKAIKNDEDNISLWFGLSEAYIISDLPTEAKKILNKAIEICSSKEMDITSLYFKIILIDVEIDSQADMMEDLEKLVNIAMQNEEFTENVAWSLVEMAEFIMGDGLTAEAIAIAETALRLKPRDKDILVLKNELIKFEKFQVPFEAFSEDDRFQEDIVTLIAIEVVPAEAMEIEREDRLEYSTMLEMSLLIEREKSISDIKEIKKYYPELYKVKEEFFEAVLNDENSEKLLKKYEKEFNKKGFLNKIKNHYDLEDSGFDEDCSYEEDKEETFVREEEKIGRNDPCPCGSGKKYKKCCGKSI
ncbi:MAG: DnaJ domain-containing protein [Clostridium sp.]|uniref:DnaJ domain-containing protein n=1 Tax=Clostridium sp. TaxID=1506 RepID=UPI003D6D8C47